MGNSTKRITQGSSRLNLTDMRGMVDISKLLDPLGPIQLLLESTDIRLGLKGFKNHAIANSALRSGSKIVRLNERNCRFGFLNEGYISIESYDCNS